MSFLLYFRYKFLKIIYNVFLAKSIYSHNASPYPDAKMGTRELNAEGNHVKDLQTELNSTVQLPLFANFKLTLRFFKKNQQNQQ